MANARRLFEAMLMALQEVCQQYNNYTVEPKGSSKKGTTSLQRTVSISPTVYIFMELIYFNRPLRGQPSFKSYPQNVLFSGSAVQPALYCFDL